jgi:predicted cobalt transporter CbtA
MNRVDYFIDSVFYGAILVFLIINVVKGLSVSSVSSQAVNPLLAAGIEKAEKEAAQTAAPASAPAAAPAKEEAPKKTPEVCPNCGKKLAEGVKFCAGCGTKIG